MQTVKPRARYLHSGQVVVWAGVYGRAKWYFYDATLTGALRSFYDFVARAPHVVC